MHLDKRKKIYLLLCVILLMDVYYICVSSHLKEKRIMIILFLTCNHAENEIF